MGISLEEVGRVKNTFDSQVDPKTIRNNLSEILIYEKYADGLDRIEDHEYLQVIYRFHKNQHVCLNDDKYDGIDRGIFSSRSSFRPNLIGLTTVKLIERKRNILLVSGLDALNGSPVLDIKPYNHYLDETLDRQTPKIIEKENQQILIKN